MACVQFREINFRAATRQLISQCNTIIARYESAGLRLTLRQLYYQLVSANVIPNVEKSYKNLGKTISEARLAGLVDWDAIEDRVRRPSRPGEFSSLQALARAALASWRLPRWADQPAYAELWVEKDALSGVLEPLSDEFHVTLMVNRGYSSQSAMYESAQRFIGRGEGKPCHLLYLGDHDPSGEDMVRDVRDRLEMFGVEDLTVTKIALTMDQVEHYNPPPNPAKMTDSRAEAYVAEHGNSSWEVDALPPDVLQQLIRTALEEIVDAELMTSCIEREERLGAQFRTAVEKIKG